MPFEVEVVLVALLGGTRRHGATAGWGAPLMAHRRIIPRADWGASGGGRGLGGVAIGARAV